MNSPIIGKVIDTYEITGILGKGGMGIVYKAHDTTLDRDVALKMMDANFARDEEFLKRFKAEAKALARLQNPNIVSVFALRETELGFCLVMEFVDGSTLADCIRANGAMPLSRAVPIFRQMATALDHAHQVGVIHRDIKPSNVMLTSADFVKVTDFGLAKIQQVSTATMTMGTGGTLYYMSPEQIKGLANVDARGDIYSLGMTLYETVAGRVPFGNDASDFDIRQMIVDGKIPPPERFNATLPPEISRLISKSIHKDPAKRFQSCAELNDALAAVAAIDQPRERRIERAAPKYKSPPSKRRPLYLTIGAGLALIGLYFGLRPFFDSPATLLSVDATPSGAQIFINSSPTGRSTVQNFAVASGEISVRVEYAGYLTKDTVMRVGEGEAGKLHVTLVKQAEKSNRDQLPTSTDSPNSAAMLASNSTTERSKETEKVSLGMLQLRALPVGSVSVDGASSSALSGDFVSMQVKSGARRVTFENPKYGSKQFTITLHPNETKKVTCYFEAEANVAVSGGAMWAYIVLDGKATDLQAPRAFTLGPGRHRVSVSKMGFDVVEGEQVVDVEPSLAPREIRLAFTLKKK
ncbi:MAG: serine/threonine protein kinase [Ignavibacteriae bacterium]|nr:serine/threonine protein kinase [Ignavibacteriota bacterium]